MKHQNYIVIRASGSNPDPATYCPANGYYDPTLPIPYIPDAAIPEIVPNDGEIVLFMSTMWDAAINCTTTRTGATGQIRYTIYGENDAQIYTQDVNSGTAFFYEFPATGGILLNSGYYGFKVVIKVATVNTLSTFRFNTKSGYAVNGWPVIEAHIKAPTLTSLTNAFDGQKALQYVKFYGDHNVLTNLTNFCYNCLALKEVQANVAMNALTTMYWAFLNTPEMEILTLSESFPALTNATAAFQNCGLKYSPELPYTLPKLTIARQMFSKMGRITGTIYIPDMPKCTDMIYVADNLPYIKKIICRGSYIPNNGSALMSFANNPMVEEIDMSAGNWGMAGVSWNMVAIFESDVSLKMVKLPPNIISMQLGGSSFTNACNSLISFTESNWSQSPNQRIQIGTRNLETFYQPTLNIKNGYLLFSATLSNQYKLKTLEIDWSNCIPETAAINISCLYCAFDQSELERIYTALPDISGYSYTGTLKFYGSPGYAASNKTIATDKGWIFATS